MFLIRRWAFNGLSVVGTLLAVSLVAFLLIALLPGDLAVLILADSATPERVRPFRAQLGWISRFTSKYSTGSETCCRATSVRSVHSGESTLHVILSRLPVTIELIGLTQIVALGLSVPLGSSARISAARRSMLQY